MFAKYLLIFFVSMVPLVELRGSIVMAVGMGLDYWTSLAACVLGNMLPVPLIYFFARKVLHWGADKKCIGKFFSYCLEKGEAAGHRLMKRAGRGGLFLALMLFVGIPIPGTGAWTGTLAAVSWTWASKPRRCPFLWASLSRESSWEPPAWQASMSSDYKEET